MVSRLDSVFVLIAYAWIAWQLQGYSNLPQNRLAPRKIKEVRVLSLEDAGKLGCPLGFQNKQKLFGDARELIGIHFEGPED